MTDYSSSESSFSKRAALKANPLMRYVSQLDADTTERLSQPTPEALQLIENNIVGMLGGLPSDRFDVTISTSREDLGRMLASAMVSGYFLHGAEQRMGFDESLMALED